jgi:hypothetical protein
MTGVPEDDCLCRCDCGRVMVVAASDLLSGRVSSCGRCDEPIRDGDQVICETCGGLQTVGKRRCHGRRRRQHNEMRRP